MITLLAVSVVTSAQAQQTPPPQTARQAVLEILSGKSPDAVQRHIPENTLAIFNKTDSGIEPMLTSQITNIRTELYRPGNHVETFDAGPLLLTAEGTEGTHQIRYEVVVDRDDLSGDEDQMELSLRNYRDGIVQRLMVVPGLILDLKEEKDIWRLNQLTVTIHVPLSDPDYVQNIADEMRKTRQRMAEYQALASLQSAKAAEVLYQKKSSVYTCDLSALGKGWDTNTEMGGKPSYVFKITNCSSTSFNVVAEPAKDSPARRALCVDETGKTRFSDDGKGSTCISSGRSVDELNADDGGRIVGFRGAID
jgi:hypothetical protein